MVSNGDRFEGAYNKIDALLRKKVSGAKTLSFSHVVNEAAMRDPTVHAVKDDLLELTFLSAAAWTIPSGNDRSLRHASC